MHCTLGCGLEVVGLLSHFATYGYWGNVVVVSWCIPYVCKV